MTADEFAVSMGYKDKAEWDEIIKNRTPEERSLILLQSEWIGLCYVLGDAHYNKDEERIEEVHKSLGLLEEKLKELKK